MDGIGSALQLGFLFSIPALAVAFSFRVIGFPDLTPDGSFVLGAAVGAVLSQKGVPTVFAFFVSLLCGSLAGITAAAIHRYLDISKLLSGILVMTMLYSISLGIMGTSNISLLFLDTYFAKLPSFPPIEAMAGMLIPVTIATIFLYALLKTERGILLRATGDNETALTVRGISYAPQYSLGLAISNGLVAGSGYITAQFQGFVDASMGTGLVIISLAAIVIGESILRPQRVITLLAAPVIGMILYQAAISLALRLGLEPAYLKISTAVLVLTFIAIDRLRFSKESGSARQIGNRNV